MKITALRLTNLGGYKSIIWDRIQPDLNFLIGKNGAGKSTILQSISMGLHYISGKRSEDVLTRTSPEGAIEIEISGAASPWYLSFDQIRSSQVSPYTDLRFHILQFVENRQPKSTIGVGRTQLLHHPSTRYPNSISEIRFLQMSNQKDQQLAAEVFGICKRITSAGSPQEWEWIQSAVKERGPRRGRPASCGQFDIIALVLDLVRLKTSVQSDDEPVFIVFDNPETYLHPACQEPLIKLTQEMFPQSQIFISSHSLKLLCHREPKSVFWLRRESQDESGTVRVLSIRELKEGAKRAFYELYGEDSNSAILGLLTSFDSPEYYRFLCDCALPSQIVLRSTPNRDRQIGAIRKQLERQKGNWNILDFGAGGGDLLAALLGWGETNDKTTYMAVEPNRVPILEQRIEEAKKGGKISDDSGIVRNLSEAPADFDVVVLLNVCHELLLPELPRVIATLLRQCLRASPLSRIVIHEAETLPVGEKRLLMWSSQEYRDVLGQIRGIVVETETHCPPKGVRLDTTIISRNPRQLDADDLEERLTEGFWKRLPDKKEQYLSEIERLSGIRKSSGLEEALRQRRLASYTAQIATICLLERTRKTV